MKLSDSTLYLEHVGAELARLQSESVADAQDMAKTIRECVEEARSLLPSAAEKNSPAGVALSLANMLEMACQLLDSNAAGIDGIYKLLRSSNRLSLKLQQDILTLKKTSLKTESLS